MRLKNFVKFLTFIIMIGVLVFGLSFLKSSSNNQTSQFKSNDNTWILEYIKKHKGEQASVPQVDYTKYVKSYSADQVSKGNILIPFSGSDKIILIDNQGNLKNQWNIDVDRARLDKKGNLLAVHGSKFRHKKEPWWTLRNTIAVYDQQGQPTWHYQGKHPIHHDANFLENGNVIFLIRDYLDQDRLNEIENQYRKKVGVEYDRIVEVNVEGKEVWSWSAIDHFDLNYCGIKDCNYRVQKFGAPLKNKTEGERYEKAFRKVRDWTHANTASIIPENQWYEQGDQRFKPGNIIFMPKNFQMFFVISEESGEIVYEENGDFFEGVKNAHEPHMIAKDLPGAGNILILINEGIGDTKRQSAIVEFEPVKREIVWTYQNKDFYNPTRGSVQRLPNGNTLVSSDNDGRVIEVNSKGKVIWEFQAPEPISRAHKYFFDF